MLTLIDVTPAGTVNVCVAPVYVKVWLPDGAGATPDPNVLKNNCWSALMLILNH
jgi:hypothetical protein